MSSPFSEKHIDQFTLWNAKTLKSEDRIHRVSQKNQCDVRYIIAKDTLDEHIYKMLKFKLETLDKLLDGRNDRTLDGNVVMEGLEEME